MFSSAVFSFFLPFLQYIFNNISFDFKSLSLFCALLFFFDLLSFKHFSFPICQSFWVILTFLQSMCVCMRFKPLKNKSCHSYKWRNLDLNMEEVHNHILNVFSLLLSSFTLSVVISAFFFYFNVLALFYFIVATSCLALGLAVIPSWRVGMRWATAACGNSMFSLYRLPTWLRAHLFCCLIIAINFQFYVQLLISDCCFCVSDSHKKDGFLLKVNFPLHCPYMHVHNEG